MRGAEERNAKGDLKQIREINCLHTFDEFASEALPYWIERAEKLEKALDRAAKYVAEVVDVCPVALDFGYEICKVNDCYDGEAACWKKYFLGEDNDERD